MIILRGAPALSDFRINKLQSKLHSLDPAIGKLSAEFVHFAKTGASLDPDEAKVLESLLQYGPQREKAGAGGELFLVMPRMGTISPWSSKATDIVHNCGLHKVQRVERGTAFWVELPGACSAALKRQISGLLHDRMVEQVMGDFAAAARRNVIVHPRGRSGIPPYQRDPPGGEQTRKLSR
jgi:phosphoribosylformylglycinamidine synthase